MTDSTIARALVAGREHLVAGRVAAAEALYDELVLREPEHAEARYGRGLVALRTGDVERAAVELGIAARLAPRISSCHAKLGEALVGLGRHTQAIVALRKALSLSGRDAESHLQLGLALSALGDARDAATCFKTARNLDATLFDAHVALGNAAFERGRAEQGERHVRAASAVADDDARRQRSLASLLRAAGHTARAREHAERAVALDGGDAAAWVELATVYASVGETALADDAVGRALAIAPQDAEAHVRSGILRLNRGEPALARLALERAIELAPELAPAHVNLALALLLQGDLRAGLRAFEWRKQLPGFRGSGLSLPEWNGSALDGRGILLYAEQGLGDALQFMRYATCVAERGGRVWLGVPRDLAPLAESVRGVHAVVPNLSPAQAAEIAVQCSLVSLPHLFGTDVGTIPASVPYVSADPTRAKRWQQEFAAERRFKIGIVWAGSAAHANDRDRSCSVDLFERIAALDGVALFSFQKDAPTEPRGPGPLVDLAPQLRDFADSAAAMSQMDLVISVDTAACHLAGALGRPVWTLLSFAPDWRWMTARDDSPWYPSMRLFRQRAPRDWAGVFASVESELLRTLAKRA